MATNNAGAAEDVLSFLNSLDEMTSKGGTATAGTLTGQPHSGPSSSTSPSTSTSTTTTNVPIPRNRSSSPSKPTAANTGSASDVLSFLDEIANSTQTQPPPQPPQPSTTNTSPVSPSSAARAQGPPSASATDSPAPPPSGGFIPLQKAPSQHHGPPRSRHIPPPDLPTTEPISHLQDKRFVPTPQPIGGNPLPPAAPPIEEQHYQEQEQEPEQQTSKWSWGSLLSTGTKLLETARDQVVQNVGVGEKVLGEQMKKMGLNTEKIREAGGFPEVGNVMDQIAPPIGRTRAGGPMMYTYFPVTLDESVAEYIPELTRFCCSETFGRGPGSPGKQLLGGEPLVKNIVSWEPSRDGVTIIERKEGETVPEGMEMAAVAAETVLENLSRSIKSTQQQPQPSTEGGDPPQTPPTPVYLVIQPFTVHLPPPLKTNNVVIHSAYLVLLHRPESEQGDRGEQIHVQCVSQSVPTAPALFPLAFEKDRTTLGAWFVEQKLRALESAIYSVFESVVAIGKAGMPPESIEQEEQGRAGRSWFGGIAGQGMGMGMGLGGEASGVLDEDGETLL